MIHIKDIPHNMEYFIDENLKEVPQDETEIKQGVHFLLNEIDKVANNDSKKLIHLYKLVGGFYRIVGMLVDSENYLNKALEIAQKENEKLLEISIQLRIASTLLEKKKYSAADKIFRKVLNFKNNDVQDKFRDYALQHLGKSLFDQERFKEALDLFLEAHEIRLIKGELHLIEASQFAIKITQSKISQG